MWTYHLSAKCKISKFLIVNLQNSKFNSHRIIGRCKRLTQSGLIIMIFTNFLYYELTPTANSFCIFPTALYISNDNLFSFLSYYFNNTRIYYTRIFNNKWPEISSITLTTSSQIYCSTAMVYTTLLYSIHCNATPD